MDKNPTMALIQIESALNQLQQTMVDENGKLTWNDRFIDVLDELVKKLEQTVGIARELEVRGR